eukprot:6002245-Amphidinium_carterae.1
MGLPANILFLHLWPYANRLSSCSRLVAVVTWAQRDRGVRLQKPSGAVSGSAKQPPRITEGADDPLLFAPG